MSHIVPEYDSSRMMIYSQICIGQKIVAVSHFSLWRFKPYFSMCGMLGKTYQQDGVSHFSVKVRSVFSKKLYPLSVKTFSAIGGDR